MSSLDTTTLIHIGVEIVVIAGITYWHHKNISSLREEVIQMRQIIEENKKIINAQGQLLMTHDQVLRGNIKPNSPPKEEPDITNDELDSLLESELNSLKNTKVEEDLSEECHEESCPVELKKKLA